MANFEVMRQNSLIHDNPLSKNLDELKIEDGGLNDEWQKKHWATVNDSEYQGALAEFTFIHPAIKQKYKRLSVQHREVNHLFKSARDIVENFYGRQTRPWAIRATCFKWKEELYDAFSRVCVTLTNFDIF